MGIKVTNMSHPIPGHDYTERSSDESPKEYRARRSSALKKSGLAKSVSRLADSVVKHDKLVRGKPGWDLFKRSYSAKDKAIKSKMKGVSFSKMKGHGTTGFRGHPSDDTRGE